MKNGRSIALFCLAFGWGMLLNGQVITYDYTGEVQTYVVPGGVSSINIEASGAQGGAEGGSGATMSGDFVVTPGETIFIVVGQEGYLQVGGNDQNSAGGGGGSFVYNEDLELYLAAGGGGGRCPYLGAVPLHPGCGGQVGESGGQNSDGTSFGGSGGEGGEAGIWSGTVCAGGGTGWLSAGEGGVHGGLSNPDWTGGDPYCDGGGGGCGGYGGFGGGGGAGNLYGGGGGGGGYSGGAGGNDPDHGGGGGSFNAGTDQVNIGANNTGHGQVVITVLCVALNIEPTDTEICEGESFIVNASSETGGIVMWDGGVENGEEFFPGGVGSYTYTATSTSGTDCNLVVEITVHDLPTIIANADPETVCFGQELTLSGSGGAFYEWSDGVENGEPFIADELGTYTYSVEGEDWYGCFNSDEVTVTVVESPEVVVTASDDNICLGESVTLTASGAVTYEWDGGVENGVSFIPEETGTFVYNVEGFVDGDGCFGEASIEVSVNESPTIESFIMLGEVFGDDGSINITVTGGTPAYDFDWDNDGVGEFGDPEDLIGIAGGTYVVVIRDANDCEDTETVTVDTQLGLSSEKLSGISVYPNPSSDFVSILFEGNFTYNISSINGEILVSGSAVNSEKVAISQLSNGIYLIEVQANDIIRTIKFVKD